MLLEIVNYEDKVNNILRQKVKARYSDDREKQEKTLLWTGAHHQASKPD